MTSNNLIFISTILKALAEIKDSGDQSNALMNHTSEIHDLCEQIKNIVKGAM